MASLPVTLSGIPVTLSSLPVNHAGILVNYASLPVTLSALPVTILVNFRGRVLLFLPAWFTSLPVTIQFGTSVRMLQNPFGVIDWPVLNWFALVRGDHRFTAHNFQPTCLRESFGEVIHRLPRNVAEVRRQFRTTYRNGAGALVLVIGRKRTIKIVNRILLQAHVMVWVTLSGRDC